MWKIFFKVMLWWGAICFVFMLLFEIEITFLPYLLGLLFKNISFTIEKTCHVYYIPISILVFWLGVILTMAKLYLDDNYDKANAKQDIGKIGRISIFIAIFILAINTIYHIIQIGQLV